MSGARSALLLGGLTLLCLLPFSGRAFHIDDPLFVWTARQIADHPLDPFGFRLVWYTTELPMSDVTRNPPLAAYYIAAIGRTAGWSERALHVAFLLPALVLILGTYRLGRRFTEAPLVAAAATLLTPAVLVSSSSVMCDTMMLALWVLAALCWIEGIEPPKPAYLVASGVLIAACALTKYFGVSLIPLLLAYGLVRQRRLGSWVWYLLIPICILAGYQAWTAGLYGRGLLTDAAGYATFRNRSAETSILANGVVGLAFAGGCALPGLLLAPALWSRKQIAVGAFLGGLAGLSVAMRWVTVAGLVAPPYWPFASIQLALYVAGGLSILALVAADCWKRRDIGSAFLSLWILGTFVFAVLLNWTINARSILPMVPAVGILLARRLEAVRAPTWRFARSGVVALIASGLVSLWVAWADADLANSARTAAAFIQHQARTESGHLWFQGHWGFHYYMASSGARPFDVRSEGRQAGDLLVIPANNTNTSPPPRDAVLVQQIRVEMRRWVTTTRQEVAAGFYSSAWGPLPFAFGRIPPEQYYVLRLTGPTSPGERVPEQRRP